ncbi:hypothetical protein [Kingella oralis]|jgi:hypothetical protein|uniref:hypothetical protein n=1 Tax=Kingella oralis TaxID=505 RepID=UPI0034E3A625
MTKIRLIDDIPGYYEFDYFVIKDTFNVLIVLYSFYSDNLYFLNFGNLKKIEIINKMDMSLFVDDESNPVLSLNIEKKDSGVYFFKMEASNFIFIIECSILNVEEKIKSN